MSNNNNAGSNESEIELDIGYYDDYLNSIITSVNNLVVSLRNANETSSKLISQKQVYYDFNKWVALKKVSSTSTTIDISYSVFDPNSEYDIVFVKLIDNDDNEKVYYLNKNNTTYSIGDLTPDTEYKLEFGYKDSKSINNIINDEVVIATTKANYELKVTRISTKNIVGTNDVQITVYYKLKVDLNYKFKSAKIVFTSNGNVLATDLLSNDTSNNSTTSISSDQIGKDGVYNGVLVFPTNVLLVNAGAENVLSLDEVVTCKRDSVDNCSIDQNINVYYKFYNE